MTAGELRELLHDVDDDTEVSITVDWALPFVEQPGLTIKARPFHAVDWSDVTASGSFEISAKAVR